MRINTLIDEYYCGSGVCYYFSVRGFNFESSVLGHELNGSRAIAESIISKKTAGGVGLGF
jgi:hypothetical protein